MSGCFAQKSHMYMSWRSLTSYGIEAIPNHKLVRLWNTNGVSHSLIITGRVCRVCKLTSVMTTYTNTHIGTWKPWNGHTGIHAHRHTQPVMQTDTHSHSFIQTHAQTRVHNHTHSYTHTHTHTHTHTGTCNPSQRNTTHSHGDINVLQCVAVCCSALQCVAVCYNPFTWRYECEYVYIRKYIHIYMFADVHVLCDTNIHTYTYTYIQSYTHKYI